MVSARHGYVGVGQAGTGTGLLQGTRSKPVPVQRVWQVFFFFYLHVASVILLVSALR